MESSATEALGGNLTETYDDVQAAMAGPDEVTHTALAATLGEAINNRVGWEPEEACCDVGGTHSAIEAVVEPQKGDKLAHAAYHVPGHGNRTKHCGEAAHTDTEAMLTRDRAERISFYLPLQKSLAELIHRSCCDGGQTLLHLQATPGQIQILVTLDSAVGVGSVGGSGDFVALATLESHQKRLS